MSSLIALSAIAIITSTISGTIGMAGGILLLTAMTFFLSIDVIVPIHGIVQLVSNSTRAGILRKHIKKKLLVSFSLGVPIGIIPSTYMISSVENKHYFYLAIALIIFFSLFKPKNLKLDLPDNYFFLVGAAVGFLGLFVGATGPFIAPFFLGSRFSKEEIVANKAIVQTVGHLVKIPAFLALGFRYQEHLLLILLLLLSSIVGTKLGTKILGKINEKIFIRIFRGALIFSAFRLLFKFFHYSNAGL